MEDMILEDTRKVLQALAEKHSGTDPLQYLEYLNNIGKLPMHIDPRLIVIPETWGVRRH